MANSLRPTVAWTLIVEAGKKENAVLLAQALGSINGYVDDIFIQLNAREGVPIDPTVRRVAEQFSDNVYTYVWKDNFVKARQDIFDKVPKKYQWVGWMDVDDKIENPENIVPSLSVMPDDVNGVYILYDYQKDQYGNVIVSHWNTRAVRNNNSFSWKSSFDDDEVAVHETLIARRSGKAVANDEWKVVHNASPEHYKDSLLRNIELLEGMASRQAQTDKGVDPRILFYLGSHYNEAYRYNEALDLFIEYLKVSGWAEERAEAHIYIGRILKNKGNLAQARNAFLMAMGENPKNPGAYLELGKLESKQERWQQAAEWLERGVEMKRDISPMVRYNYDYELFTNYAQALANLGGKNLTKALKMAQEALKLRPYDEDAKENRDNIQRLVGYRNNLRAVNTLIKELNSEKKQITPLLDALPESIQDSVVVVNARQTELKPTKWPKRSIAIYVGQGPLGNWGPNNLNNGGLGGSEEAVIRLSRELARLGWKVTVFGTPGKQAGFDLVKQQDQNIPGMETEEWIHNPQGVRWRHYWEINNNDTFDVLISWRQPGFFDHKWKARKTYLWLHDVVDKEELTPERIKNVTKVIYVSKYHAERPENALIPEKKKLASGNGITPNDFQVLDGRFERQPLRCIYMSANERGLRILLDTWPAVREAVPGATLDAYYGWNSFDAVNRDNPERMAWKATMVARMKELDGVTERGRIGQDDLNKEIFKSGVFAYPCFFPEVYAITYVKALAGGAQAVTSDFAVLKEYEEYATQVHLGSDIEEFKEEYKKALIHALKNPMSESKRQAIAKEVRERYSWANTAQGWDREMS